jgi:hypothetical protein
VPQTTEPPRPRIDRPVQLTNREGTTFGYRVDSIAPLYPAEEMAPAERVVISAVNSGRRGGGQLASNQSPPNQTHRLDRRRLALAARADQASDARPDWLDRRRRQPHAAKPARPKAARAKLLGSGIIATRKPNPPNSFVGSPFWLCSEDISSNESEESNVPPRTP